MKRKRSPNLPHKPLKSRISILSARSISVDPFDQFNSWFQQVLDANVLQPYSMVLATASAHGKPSARIVLLKGVDQRGFSFYTNYESTKGKQLSENAHAALLFYWPQLDRQIRIEGTIEKLTREESLTYFSTRPRNSRLGAWASHQSEIIANRSSLESEFKRYQKQFRNSDVPLPDYWGGYRLIPCRIEFWQSRSNRLHDRISYVREDGTWKINRLSP
jgi:pyridoxamine 5'-phosphate oxidase